MSEWFNRRGRIYFYDQYALNEQETAFSKYDPDRIAEELEGTGADVMVIYAANQFGIAYYPSRIWPQHPNLKGRDYVGDLISRLRRRGKKVITYINWLNSKQAEWNMVPIGHENDPYFAEQPLVSWAEPSKPNGRIQKLPGGHWRQTCFNSPHREQIVAVTREIVERYRPDGFHLDMVLNTDICVCGYCRPTLEAICGTKEITREAVAAHWIDYINWRCESSSSLLAEVSAILREHGVVAAHNLFNPIYVQAFLGLDRAWLDSLDVLTSECFDAFGSPCSDLNSAGITVRWQHAEGKPAWILRTSTPSHYGHRPISEAKWQLYASACKANGCELFGPCGVGARPDTTTSEALLSRLENAFDFYMRDADLDEGAVSAAKIALVFSWATRKYFEPDVSGRLEPLQWAEEFTGWARLLVEEHLPFDVVTAERVTSSDDLTKYELVILPNAANVSDAFCSSVREYVRRGGRILATAETSLRNDDGGNRTDFALGDVMGVSREGTSTGSFAVEWRGEMEPATGNLQQIVSPGEVIARYVTVDPAGSVLDGDDPLPMEVTDRPVVVKNAFGAGESVYVAFDIGRFYTSRGDEHTGNRMAQLVDSLAPERQIIVKGPRTVEVTLWEQDAPTRTIIHLANRTVPWTLPTGSREITEIVPVHNVEIWLKKPYSDSAAAARGFDISSKIEADRLVVHISRLDAYGAVVIEPRR